YLCVLFEYYRVNVVCASFDCEWRGIGDVDRILFCLVRRRPPSATLFPYTTLFRSLVGGGDGEGFCSRGRGRTGDGDGIGAAGGDGQTGNGILDVADDQALVARAPRRRDGLVVGDVDRAGWQGTRTERHRRIDRLRQRRVGRARAADKIGVAGIRSRDLIGAGR